MYMNINISAVGGQMAEPQIEGDELVLHLTQLEEFEAVHGDLRAPLSAVRGVEVLEDAHEPADHGLKVGERLPGVSEVATMRADGERMFAAVHHDTPRGVHVSFQGTGYDAWIVGCSKPEATKSRIDGAR
jgi:hypothetical protein